MAHTTQMVMTPTGPLAVIRPVAEQLLAQGVISGTLDGALHAADAATVKAAVLAAARCDFCSTAGAAHVFDVPDFEMGNNVRSTDGWSACDACAEMVRADRRKALLERALQHLAFSKFTKPAITDLHNRFWRAMEEKVDTVAAAAALADYINDTLPPDVAQPSTSQRDMRIERVLDVTGITRQQLDTLLGGKLDHDAMLKLREFSKRFGGNEQRPVRDVVRTIVDGPVKPMHAAPVPHWQRALDARFEALSTLSAVLKKEGRQVETFPDATDLNDPAAVAKVTRIAQARASLRDLGFEHDVKFLHAAQAYSFNGETIAAIREAARGIPRDAPLSSIETPNTGAGWFWFGEPLPVTASPAASGKVHALLWGWTSQPTKVYEVDTDTLLASLDGMRRIEVEHALRAIVPKVDGAWAWTADRITRVGNMLRNAGVTQQMFNAHSRAREAPGEPQLAFSAYVVNERGPMRGRMVPSTRWHWPFSASFAEMLERSSEWWETAYGEDSPLHGDPLLVGKSETLHCIAELSLFFVMACLWFKQTVPVLTREPGHIERHARRRYAREHQLPDVPTVQVVALRKSQRTPAADAPAERSEGAREYHCRWIVKGHPRLQACGPGRKDRKLIWIEAHPAGPPDKPLRTREKVFAVVR